MVRFSISVIVETGKTHMSHSKPQMKMVVTIRTQTIPCK